MKAISPGRDRMQSRSLNALLGAALVLTTAVTLTLWATGPSRRFLLVAILVSTAFAAVVLRLRASTLGGAAAGALISLLLIVWTATPLRFGSVRAVLHSALTPLLLLFLCSFAATRAGRITKASRGLAESSRGRGASQVLANLAAAALLAGGCGLLRRLRSDGDATAFNTVHVSTALLALGALAEAAADTVSSELGQAFGGRPRMLLTLERVTPGTDGAITGLGTAAGILAALLIALVGGSAMQLGVGGTLWAFLGGVVGLFADSLLGATLERRGLLGNDLVNFVSTLVGALTALAGVRILAAL